ncbi:MAG: WD40 repeat domain-containing protein [Phycisphaeraceae bacterium]|nr:WD40 repeat domain-containing protein [Phycisphaeraceae bacterium]
MLAILRAGAAAAAICAWAGAAFGDGFVAGRIYSSYDGGFVEWDTDLHVTRSVPISGLGGASGIVFNSAGNMVMIGYRQNAPRLLEVNGLGAIIRSTELNTGGSLLRGSYVDFNAAAGRYVVAEGRRVRLLDADFNTVATTADVFTRASGVAFAPDGRVYAVDQTNGTLRIFSAGLSPLGTVSIGGWVRTGMELADNGDLLLTAFGDGTIQRWRPPSGPLTTLVSGLGYGNLSDVDQLPDGRIVSISASNTLKLYTESGQLLATGSFAAFGDGVAYFVPAPGSASALAVLLLAARRRRR